MPQQLGQMPHSFHSTISTQIANALFTCRCLFNVCGVGVYKYVNFAIFLRPPFSKTLSLDSLILATWFLIFLMSSRLTVSTSTYYLFVFYVDLWMI